MRLTLIFIITCIVFTSFAQKEIGSLNLGFERAKNSNVKLYAFSNSNKDTSCTIAYLNGNGKGFILDKNGKLLNSFSFVCPFKKALVISGVVSDGQVHFLMAKNNLEDSLLVFNYTIKQNAVLQTIIASPIPNNKQLVSICDLQGAICFVEVDKKKAILRVYKLSLNNSFLMSQFDFSDLVDKEYKGEKLYTKINELSSMMHLKMAIISDPNLVPVDVLTCHKKIYFQKDLITLTIESREKTDIFFINTITNEHFYKQVNHKSEVCANHDPQYTSYNTFLFNKNFYSINACKDALEINVIDIDNNKILNRLIVRGKDEITFKNTPVIEEAYVMKEFDNPEYLETVTSEKKIEKSKKVLKKMAYGWSLIIPRIDSLERTELTIGGFMPETFKSGVPIGFMPAPYNGLVGIVGLLTSSLLWSMLLPVEMSGNNWDNTIHFKSLLDSKSFEHINGAVSLSPENYKTIYKNAHKLEGTPEIMFQLASKYYYAYVNIDSGMLVYVSLN